MNYAYLLRMIAISVATMATFSPFANAMEVGTLSKAVHAEEQRLGARIGMAVFDAKDGTRWAYRGDELFPLNSTHKPFSCAALLEQVDWQVLALDSPISMEGVSLVTYSPVMEKAGGQVTLREACAASVSRSDKTLQPTSSPTLSAGPKPSPPPCVTSATHIPGSIAKSLR